MIITIDGLTATGKSSVARLLAQKLGYMHINSGLLFRTLAYLLVTKYHYADTRLKHPNKEDVDACLDKKKCLYVYNTTNQTSSIFYEGSDITANLMTKSIDLQSSLGAVDPYVHQVITAYVRALADHQNIVIDGRNAGTLIFPQAEKKFFLTASLDVRAHRWQKERGKGYTHQVACEALHERDQRDIHRVVAPLIIPQDAQVVDTSCMDQQEVCAYLLSCIQNK